MDDGTVAGAPGGRRIPPWHYPARPRVERLRVPATPQSLQRLAGMARAPEGNKPKLLDQVREAIRMRQYSIQTEEAYVGRIRRFLLFHGKRHALEMGADEITQFLSALAVSGQVSALTQHQALCALVFLSRHLLGRHFGWLKDVVRAKRPRCLPVVWTRPEIRALLGALEGVHWIMASLLSGAGLRLLECLRLRVKDMDFASHQMLLPEGKGQKDRRTMLPAAVQEPLADHDVGGLMGMLCVLHTWTRTPADHPHVQGLVPAGGELRRPTRVAPARTSSLVSVHPLAKRFRGRLLALGRQAPPDLTLPESVWTTGVSVSGEPS
jgi:hypothetical protein